LERLHSDIERKERLIQTKSVVLMKKEQELLELERLLQARLQVIHRYATQSRDQFAPNSDTGVDLTSSTKGAPSTGSYRSISVLTDAYQLRKQTTDFKDVTSRNCDVTRLQSVNTVINEMNREAPQFMMTTGLHHQNMPPLTPRDLPIMQHAHCEETSASRLGQGEGHYNNSETRMSANSVSSLVYGDMTSSTNGQVQRT